jgi:two-component system KDP operon response regulator KdpE
MRRTGTILLVDDDPAGLRAIRRICESEGFLCLEAGTVRDALATARREGPDVIVLDMSLPDGSGIEAAATLKSGAGTARIPIIAVSGLPEPAFVPQATAAGCAFCLPKPYDPHELVSRVRELLRQPTDTPPPPIPVV